MAFDVVFLMCSLKFSWESSQIPRYQITLAGAIVFVSFGVFVGIVADGPGPECLPLMDLVKCMSSFLTWSVLRPLSVSHVCASRNAISTSLVAVVLSWAEAMIDPSSTYKVRGARFAFPAWVIWLSS